MELFPFLLEQDIQRMIIMKAIVAITKLMLLNLIRFSAMSVVIMDSTSAGSESVLAMEFNSMLCISSVDEFVPWKSAMFKCYQWIVLDGTERTQVSKLDIVLVTVFTEIPWYDGEYLRFAPRSQAQRICSVMLPTSGYSEANVSAFDSHNLFEEIPVQYYYQVTVWCNWHYVNSKLEWNGGEAGKVNWAAHRFMIQNLCSGV